MSKRGCKCVEEISGKIFMERGVLIFIIMNLRDTIKRILNEELGDTKSNYKKQVRIFEKLLKSKSYEGVCGFIFIEDEDDDRVRSIMIKFSEVWYLTDNDSLYLNKKLRLIQETKKKVADIIGRYLNLDNIYVGSYLENCDSSLNEQKQPTDVAFQKVLKRVIPDNSIYEKSFYVPRGYTHVMMKYSVLPESRLEHVKDESGYDPDIHYDDVIRLELQIHELLSKSSKFEDFYGGYKPIREFNDLDEDFWSLFEDDLGYKIRRSLGIDSFVIYYKFPDTIKQ
jgi:hypothetical protein